MARLDDPDCDIGLWRVAWDGDEVVGSVLNAIYRLENERLGVSRGWLDHVSVRRRWRGLGVAKALCAASFRALAGARDRGGVARASTRRTRPARSSCTRASGSRSPSAGWRTRGRWTVRRPRAGSRTSSRCRAPQVRDSTRRVDDSVHAMVDPASLLALAAALALGALLGRAGWVGGRGVSSGASPSAAAVASATATTSSPAPASSAAATSPAASTAIGDQPSPPPRRRPCPTSP